MVNRILAFEATIGQNVVDEVIGTHSPPSDNSYEIFEIWFDTDEPVEYSLSLNERKLIDGLPAAESPSRDLPLPFDLRVEGGQDLKILASETAGAEASPKCYMRVEES